MQREELMHGARRLAGINAGVQKGEKVLVIGDTSGENPEIARAMMQAAKELGADVTLCLMEPRSTHGENPTALIAEMMPRADVIFAPTRYSLSHSKAREAANEAGCRFISMPDYHGEMLLPGAALDADFLEIYKTVLRLQKKLGEAGEIHVQGTGGTDIRLRAEGRVGNEVSGVCRAAGTWGSPPNIEVNISPIEGETQGRVVVDGSIPLPQIGLIAEGQPLQLEIRDGRISSFSKGEQAEAFREILDGENQPENLVLAEFGIGLNDHAKLCGSMLEDEGAFGTAHFGFGHNFDQGGQNQATKHIDCVFCKPTVTLDGEVILKDGLLMIGNEE